LNENAINSNHPRAISLNIREKLVEGFRMGLVVPHGLISHGRGEAFDYLIGEVTTKMALESEIAAASLLLISEAPIISVNGNTASLCALQLVKLSDLTNSLLEVNLYHKSKQRSKAIASHLTKNGAKKVYGITPNRTIEGIASNRKYVDKNGIYKADTVLIAVEDGDRAEALIKLGLNVIAIDINPLSRTAQNANITIVDNIVRALANMITLSKELRNKDKAQLRKTVENFDNAKNIDKSIRRIRRGF
jgi:4-phosphopantoate---beta-alanine ligase